MFGYGKAKLGYSVGIGERSGAYNGAGIWYRCQETRTVKRTEEPDAFRDLRLTQGRAVGARSAALLEALGLDRPGGRWDALPDTPRFVFTTPDGRRFHARYGVIGSWNDRAHSWLWSWQFPRGWMPRAACRPAALLRAEGLVQGWRALTEPLLYLGEEEAWQLTCLAAYRSGHALVYSAMVNDRNRHFFVIGRPVLEV